MHLLIYPEEPDDDDDGPCKYLSSPPSAQPIPEPGPPSKKYTDELTSEPNYDAYKNLPPKREGSMGHLSPEYITR